MRKASKITLLLLLIHCALFHVLNAQVGINAEGSDPDASAMLDISSNDKGLLIPRMDSTSRQNIQSPAEGLMVFDSTTNSFWYYSTNWTEVGKATLLADTDGDTKIQGEANNDEDIIRFDLNGTEFMRLDSGRIEILNTGSSIFIGEGAGANDDYSENNNVFIGQYAGNSNTTGNANIFIGKSAGETNTDGYSNVFLGQNTGRDNTTGYANVFVGRSAGFENTIGDNNTFFGQAAGYKNTSGNNNLYLGKESGFKNTTGEGNIFLGYKAGYDETGSNKLYIDNSNTSSPLIYGDFDIDSLQINGKLNIGGNYSFPTTDGAASQIITTDGSGTLSWTDIPDDQILTFDADTLTISNGNTVDLSSLRSIDENGLSIVTESVSTLDIEQEDYNATVTTYPVAPWQSFIPNQSGYLSQIDFYFGSDKAFDGGNFLLYSGTGIDGTLLYSKAVGNLADGWQSIDLIEEEMLLAENTTYTFTLEDTVNYEYTYTIHTGNLYADGIYGIDDNPNTAEDLQFRTYCKSASDVSTNILTVNSLTSDTATFNFSHVDTLHFSDGTFMTSGEILTDADGNTKIQLEESADEDIIRFDLGGTEFMRLDSGRIELVNTGNSIFIGEAAGQYDDYDNNVNVFVGYKAGQNNTTGYRNVFLGAEAGDGNTSGVENIFVGFKAGYGNTTGNGNIFLGQKAGFYETGSNKLYIENTDTISPLIYGEFDNDLLQVNGTLSISSSATEYVTIENGRIETVNSSNSVFIGEEAGQNDDSTDNKNVFVGYQSGKSNTDGHFNVYIGNNAGQASTDGENNVFTGHRSGYNNTSGRQNVFLGALSGFNNTTGTQNIFIGEEAGYTNTTGDGNVFIGFEAGRFETGNSKLYIEYGDATTPLIYGEFDNDLVKVNGTFEATKSVTGNNNYVLTIENTANNNNSNNNGLLIKAGHDDFTSDEESSMIRFNTPNGTNLGRIRQESGSEIKLITSSDRRLKENIQPTHYGIRDILAIEVKDYNFITDADEHVKTGFIAQQLHTIFPTAVAVGDDVKTNPWGVDYAGLTPLLVKGMQDQQAQIEALNMENEALKIQVSKIQQLEQQNLEMKAMMEAIQAQLNQPNARTNADK